MRLDFPKPDNCSEKLKERGRTYPRTCAVCGLGPCLYLPSPYTDERPGATVYSDPSDDSFLKTLEELEEGLETFQEELEKLAVAVRWTRWSANILSGVLLVIGIIAVWKWF